MQVLMEVSSYFAKQSVKLIIYMGHLSFPSPKMLFMGIFLNAIVRLSSVTLRKDVLDVWLQLAWQPEDLTFLLWIWSYRCSHPKKPISMFIEQVGQVGLVKTVSVLLSINGTRTILWMKLRKLHWFALGTSDSPQRLIFSKLRPKKY